MPDLKKLFSLKSASAQADVPQIPTSSNQRIQGETYEAYGRRICGMTTGSCGALGAMLQMIYNNEKNSQINNESLQETHRRKVQNEMSLLDQQIVGLQTRQSGLDVDIDTVKNKINDCENEIDETKGKEGQLNKMERVKLIFGCVLLVILTVYLFIFYSSTFYSAFFKATGDWGVGAAMFDPHALSNALNDGFGELLFILCAPIIFLGLGFCLHFFNVQPGKAKYFKMSAIVAITLVFDCILAYLIAERIYNFMVTNSWQDFPLFSIKIAIEDVNVWAVIFCGFIVYIIWGIIFDMTLTAYERLRSYKFEIKQLRNSLNQLKQQLNQKQQEAIGIQGDISACNSKRNGLQNKLAQNVFFDPHVIKTSLSDFFGGWTVVMSSLGIGQDQQGDSHKIYDQTITTLFP